MIKNYQVTISSKSGKYKPVSCIVKANEILTLEQKKEVMNKGVVKIAQQRRWTNADLVKYEYTLVRIREYDKEKIKQENEKRYEQIKKEKYACGEWKAPRKKV